jgi:hypothetical protein
MVGRPYTLKRAVVVSSRRDPDWTLPGHQTCGVIRVELEGGVVVYVGFGSGAHWHGWGQSALARPQPSDRARQQGRGSSRHEAAGPSESSDAPLLAMHVRVEGERQAPVDTRWIISSSGQDVPTEKSRL